MGNLLSWLFATPIFPEDAKLKVILGPDQNGYYFIRDNQVPILLVRYRFRANHWEWNNGGNDWLNIPTDLSPLRLMPSTVNALAELRDMKPKIRFERHLKQKSVLGNGYFGQVYKVKFDLIMGHENFLPANKDLAMKTIKQQHLTNANDLQMAEMQRDALQNEIEMLKRISHPTIVRFYQCILYEGSVAMVTELCSGGTAEGLLRSHSGLIPQATILTMISHCLQAVKVLHDQSIIHRDIKPDNIFVMKNGGGLLFKLGDFGLSKVMSNNFASNQGCRRFLAPEILMTGPGTKLASRKSDVWALGLTVFVMCTKSFPNEVLNPVRLALATQMQLPRINRVVGVPNAYCNEIQAFLDACMQVSFAARATTDQLCLAHASIIAAHPVGPYMM